MDVKPSNVLIAADGHPMLLDFHLASKSIEAGERFLDRIGGTPGWMAPEHAAALEAVTLGQPIPEKVDPRADIFALGLLLRTALVGPSVGQKDEVGSDLHERNPTVTTELDEIIRKCLNARPDRRYPSAYCVANDLRRQVELLRETGRMHDRPNEFRIAGLILLAVLSVTLACYSILSYEQRKREIETDIEEGRGFAIKGQYEDAVQALSRDLGRARAFPTITGLLQVLPPISRLSLSATTSSARRYAGGMQAGCTTSPTGFDSTTTSTLLPGKKRTCCSATSGQSGNAVTSC